MNTTEKEENKKLYIAEVTDVTKKLVPKDADPEVYLTLIRDQVMGRDKIGKQRSVEDFHLFLYVCKNAGLDPLLKQIYPIFFWNNALGKEQMSIVTGIDGYRLTAQRSKEYGGSDDVIFDPIDESTAVPTKATCTVYRIVKGMRVPFTATVRWNEYVKKNYKTKQPEGFWKTAEDGGMPYNQLGKVAEAAALRKAFPRELSGVYLAEEMDRANPVQNLLGDLPTPTKPEEEIKVEHGAPIDNQPIERVEAKVEIDIAKMQKENEEKKKKEATE